MAIVLRVQVDVDMIRRRLILRCSALLLIKHLKYLLLINHKCLSFRKCFKHSFQLILFLKVLASRLSHFFILLDQQALGIEFEILQLLISISLVKDEGLLRQCASFVFSGER